MHPLNDGTLKMKIQRTDNKINISFKARIFDKFAKYYDQIYHDKNYKKECNFVSSVLRRFGKRNVKSILDLGCGTGGHALIFAKKGYSITGIDMSDTALQLARKKFQKAKTNGQFLKGDISDFSLRKKFDACISMFCSFCYITEALEIKRSLKCVSDHLNSNGLFIFDFWNGNTVINEKPSTKVKIIKIGKRRIIRIATPRMDYSKHICTIEYHCIIDEDNKIVDEFRENHKIRYHFPADLSTHLTDAGFEMVGIMPMNASNQQSDNNTFLNEWYLFAIARKK